MKFRFSGESTLPGLNKSGLNKFSGRAASRRCPGQTMLLPKVREMYKAFSKPLPREESLVQSLFVSTATEPLSMERGRTLLRTAARRSEELDITGLLLYANQRFMGVLEGPEFAVEESLHAIRADHRHKNIDLIRFEKISERLFSRWQMSMRNFTVDLELLPAMSRFMDPEFDISGYEAQSNDVCRAMLAFRNSHTPLPDRPLLDPGALCLAQRA